jgi:EAL domain-containing protein (putative c-di-GMP-specific phosphodiesterase class I)/CheY-like chemotaxis protein
MTADTIRILVVDDDADLTNTVRAALEAQGYDVLTANDGERGLELAFTEHPHLVLLDVMMPGLDGYRVCRELQFGYTKDIPVIFLTAKAEVANMMEANRSGASAYITKPFRVDHLLETVRDVLRDASVYYDEITGLPTLANVQVDVQRMLFGHSQLGIIYVTLDGVHALEQLQGFEVVDEVFRIVGQRLIGSRGQLIRGDDFISISSLGNAFLIVLSAPRDRAVVSDDDLLAVKRRLEEQLLVGLEQELQERLLVKIGLYVGYAHLAQSPKVRFKRALLEAIDQAMRGIQLERDESRRMLRDEFDRVLADEQISCVYQPIVSLDDYTVLGYELLARGPLQSPLHRPDALFEVARGQGREAELDRLCRLEAARTSATLPTEFLRFINTEPVSLFANTRSGFIVRELVEATPPELRGQTIVELTENSVIEDFSHMREVVRQLRDQGFRIAIDDAGAGHSGLQTMVELEPDFIKLDISLTRGLETSFVKQKLIATLRDFCREAGVTLIAEGIETRSQLDALIDLGIAYGQGFLFAHPGSPYPIKVRIPPPGDAARQSPAASDALRE